MQITFNCNKKYKNQSLIEDIDAFIVNPRPLEPLAPFSQSLLRSGV